LVLFHLSRFYLLYVITPISLQRFFNGEDH